MSGMGPEENEGAKREKREYVPSPPKLCLTVRENAVKFENAKSYITRILAKGKV
jgi:hypothetical protein